MPPLVIRNYGINDLMPLVIAWLEKNTFEVSILANRIDGTLKTGFLSTKKVTVYIENYYGSCSVTLEGTTDVCRSIAQYLYSLPPRSIPPPPPPSKETVIIKEREIVSIPCQYCRTLIKVNESRCPNCGAPIH